MMQWETGAYPNVGRSFVTMGCMHCEDPSCKMACDAIGVNAISKNEFGVVLIDYDKCIGCQYCQAVCPDGVPQYNAKVANLYPDEGPTPPELITAEARHATHFKKAKTVEKCTFCWHKLEKAVAKGETSLSARYPNTPRAAIWAARSGLGSSETSRTPRARSRSGWVPAKATQLKKEFGTRPQVFYKLTGGD